MRRFLSENGLFKINGCCILGPGSTLQRAMKKNKMQKKNEFFFGTRKWVSKVTTVLLTNYRGFCRKLETGGRCGICCSS